MEKWKQMLEELKKEEEAWMKKRRRPCGDTNGTEIAKKIVCYINGLEEEKKNKVTAELIREMETTYHKNLIKSYAYILSDIKCQKAVQPLIQLIYRPDLKSIRGNLLDALGKLDCAEAIPLLIPLLFQRDSYEARWDMHILLEEWGPKLNEEARNYCLCYIRKELEELEDTLYRGYDVYENVLKGEPFWEEDK